MINKLVNILISGPAIVAVFAVLYTYIQSSIEIAIFEARKVKQNWMSSVAAILSTTVSTWWCWSAMNIMCIVVKIFQTIYMLNTISKLIYVYHMYAINVHIMAIYTNKIGEWKVILAWGMVLLW